MDLPKPRVYHPYTGGVYQVAPLLKVLELNNPTKNPDQDIFQIDSEWKSYRQSKEAALNENTSKYLGMADLDPVDFHKVALFIAGELAAEHPQLFEFDPATGSLRCRLSGETVLVDRDRSPLDLWKELSLQVQEDLALWKVTPDREWLAGISVCSPSYWAPETKLGRSFAEVHAPVAGIGPINRNARQMAETMVLRGPFIRFAWGISTDTRLNHHPHPPPGVPREQWAGRSFNVHDPQAFVRVERQCLVPFPEIKCALFTIRTYFVDVTQLKKEPPLLAALASALRSMSPESLVYNSLQDTCQDLLKWMETPL